MAILLCAVFGLIAGVVIEVVVGVVARNLADYISARSSSRREKSHER
jgi:hypothetical protein